jgi:hypothetical protein
MPRAIAALAAFTLIAANASEVRVSGVLDRWDVYSFATDTQASRCDPVENPCTESQVRPRGISRARLPLAIPVTGRATIVGADITALTLRLSKPVTLTFAGDRHGEMTLAGLVWNLRDGIFEQARGTSVRCPAGGTLCRIYSAAIAGPPDDSPLHFDGIPAGFPIRYGALLLDAHRAFSSTARDRNSISVSVTSSQRQASPNFRAFNAASFVHFTLAAEATE